MLLALDPSTKSTGYSVLDNNGKLVTYGCITASSSNLHKRIDKIVGEIESLLKTYDIDRVVMEDPLPADVKGNRTVYKALMYLQAFIVHLFDSYKIKTIDFMYPSEWRAKLKIKNGRGIKRETEKEYDMAYVKEVFNIEANDDVCDAICIAVAYTAGKPAPIILEGGFELG